MDYTVKVALAQIELVVGDIAGNTKKIINYSQKARDEFRADLVIFPELSICGYPPEDLLFHRSFQELIEGALVEIRKKVFGINIIIGFPKMIYYYHRGIFVYSVYQILYNDQKRPN